ncbi:class I SAM-dependent methyltransferase [Nitriliruptoraceae bacterium ZYF776]|nr:class I SAM-dependent methyltransferase [Profundirhabdus halotolerans]
MTAPVAAEPPVPAELARGWVERFERMQARYSGARAARRAAVLAQVERACSRPGPARRVVLELGAGPGTLAAEVVARCRGVVVVAIEPDPLLRALGRATVPRGVRYVDRVAGLPGWDGPLAGDLPVRAVVADAVLHYLDAAAPASLHAELRGLLDRDGVVVVADQLPDAGSPADAGATDDDDGETWTAWWQAAVADPTLRAVAGDPRGPVLDGDGELTVQGHRAALVAGGFTAVDEVWRRGDSAVLVARP